MTFCLLYNISHKNISEKATELSIKKKKVIIKQERNSHLFDIKQELN